LLAALIIFQQTTERLEYVVHLPSQIYVVKFKSSYMLYAQACNTLHAAWQIRN